MSEPTALLPADEPHPRRSRRGLVIVAVAAVVVVVLGAAAFAAYRFLDGGGPRPEDALPSSTIAVMSVDLDPHAGQKIAAIESLRKFPALRKSLGINSEDDLRQEIVDRGLGKVCPRIDYARDVKPWLGDRAAIAAVDLGGKQPAPALVLQISDRAKAQAGFAAIAACAKDSGHLAGVGYAVGDDYLIASDTQAHAEAILTGGRTANLADDLTYRRWSDARGGAGVVNFYVAPQAGRFLGNALADQLGALPGVAGQLSSQLGGQDPAATVKGSLGSFGGASGALKFADGGMELVIAAKSSSPGGGAVVGKDVEALPADTALVAGLAIPQDLAQRVVARAKTAGPSGTSLLDSVETQTGLRLPQDLHDLLGNAVTFSVGGQAPADAHAFDDPTNVPFGVVLHGDPARALAIITSITDHLGVRLSDIPVATAQGRETLVLSPSKAYAEELTAAGGLGSDPLFRKAIPDADHAQSLLYLAIDTRWRNAIADLAGDSLSAQQRHDLIDNLSPFGALGLSSTTSDGIIHVDLRIATR